MFSPPLRKFDDMRLAFLSRVALRFSTAGAEQLLAERASDSLPVLSPGSEARGAACLARGAAGGWVVGWLVAEEFSISPRNLDSQ